MFYSLKTQDKKEKKSFLRVQRWVSNLNIQDSLVVLDQAKANYDPGSILNLFNLLSRLSKLEEIKY